MSARKRPGGSRLDDIMGKTAKLHATIRPSRANEDPHEVGSHMMLPPVPPSVAQQQQGGPPLAVCRNPECNHTIFDMDYRAGAKVCMSCGTVQNNRGLESLEEEHRTFADDEDKDAKKRVEKNDGKTGGRVGDASLRGASGIANTKEDKEEKKLERTKDKIKELASMMNIPHAIKDTAFNLCTNLAESHKAHDELCKNPKCRLRSRKKEKQELVAAAVLQIALRKANLGRQFQEFAAAMRQHDFDAEAFRTDVGEAFNLAKDHLSCFDNGRTYPCIAPDATILNEGDQSEQGMKQITSLFPRFCQQINMPYRVEGRALETYEKWFRRGTKTALPQTMAAAAILSAATELKEELEATGHTFDLSLLSKASGIQESTINKTLKEHAVPPGAAGPSSAT